MEPPPGGGGVESLAIIAESGASKDLSTDPYSSKFWCFRGLQTHSWSYPLEAISNLPSDNHLILQDMLKSVILVAAIAGCIARALPPAAAAVGPNPRCIGYKDIAPELDISCRLKTTQEDCLKDLAGKTEFINESCR